MKTLPITWLPRSLMFANMIAAFASSATRVRCWQASFMPNNPSSASAPADPTQWSTKSQRSAAADFTSEYKDRHYKCWHCGSDAVFTAEEQKYTYEVKKADMHQNRSLCETCWRESLRIGKDLKTCASAWSASKAARKDDVAFLSRWLLLLESQETYVPSKRDVARKNVLRKLLNVA